jgi:hypothetical protein
LSIFDGDLVYEFATCSVAKPKKGKTPFVVLAKDVR